MQEEDCLRMGWASLPPELLRRVVQQLLTDWHYDEPSRPYSSLLPVRSTCRAWRAVVDSDVSHVALTVPSITAECLAINFPNATSLDLSRYQRSCQDVFPCMQQLRLRSLVLADPWDAPALLPAQCLTLLTHLSFQAEGLLVPHLASQFCAALALLQQLRRLALCRLQLSQQTAQLLAQTLPQLPRLEQLALSGGAAPVTTADLYTMLNVELPGLRDLELTRLGARMLPLSLTKLAGITRLTFSGEMVRNLPLSDELRQISSLQVLDISANLAEQLPVGILELSNLRELHAGMNRLGVHMHSFRKLEELQVLVLASNKLVGVHSSLWSLTSLARLDLGHNNLTELPQDASQLTGLTYLSICHNFLTALPAGLSCLVNLVDLDVSLNTDMRELPHGLGQLSKLTCLTASHMRLKQLPSDVGGLVSLVHLDVSHNSLHHLSSALASCVGLTHLEASDNKLHQSAAVPEELASLTALKVLRLARNRLQTLPEALGCYGRLQILDCSGNRLTSVPRVVGRCTALQQLLMASNRLRGLTSGIGNLLRLQVLDLSHNQYRHLPTMTGDLTQLQSLLLEDNQLEDLPSSCSALVKLSELTLSNNRLHVLPPAISQMSGLMTLSLSNNPLLGRDVVVLQLQRQLPKLRVDSLPPLQSGSCPPVDSNTKMQCHTPALELNDSVTQQAQLTSANVWELAGVDGAATVPVEPSTATAAAPTAVRGPAATASLSSAALSTAAVAAAALSPIVPPWLLQMQQGADASSGGSQARSSLLHMLRDIIEGAGQGQQPQGPLTRLLGNLGSGLGNVDSAVPSSSASGRASSSVVQEPFGITAACNFTLNPVTDGAGSSTTGSHAAVSSSGGTIMWCGEATSGAGLTASQPVGGQEPAAQQPFPASLALWSDRDVAFSAASAHHQHVQTPLIDATDAVLNPAGVVSIADAGHSMQEGVQQPAPQQQKQLDGIVSRLLTVGEAKEDDDTSEVAASLGATSSRMGSLDGCYVSSLDGRNTREGASARTDSAVSLSLAASHLQDASSSSVSIAAMGGSGCYAARVKSYLEAATSSNNSSAGGASGTHVLSRQESGSSGCYQQHLQQHQQVHHSKPDVLYSVGSVGTGSQVLGGGVNVYGDASGSQGASAGSSAAAAAASASATGAVPCAEVDEVCSTGGLDSCGSEDSGSEVLVRLGTPSSKGHAFGHVENQQLEPGAAALGAKSRYPSSNSSGAVLGVGIGNALPAGNISASGYHGISTRDVDAESCTTNGDEIDGSAEPAAAQQVAVPVSDGQQAQLPSQRRTSQQRQSGDRSFAHVLESAWWGRRRG